MKKIILFALVTTLALGMTSCSKEEKTLVSKEEAEGTTKKEKQDAMWAKFSTTKNNAMKGYWVNYSTVYNGLFDEKFYGGGQPKGYLYYYFDGTKVTSYIKTSSGEWKQYDGPFEYKCGDDYNLYVRTSDNNYVVNTYEGAKKTDDELYVRIWDGNSYAPFSEWP